MDPNSQNPQGDSEAVKKLENDLNALAEETKSVESQSVAPLTIPEEQPMVSSPVVEAPPVVPTGPETATPETQTAIVPPNPSKKSSPLMIVAIVLIVLAVLAVIVYVFGSKLTKVEPTPVPAVTIMPTVVPTNTPVASESASPLATSTPMATASATSSPSATMAP